MTTRVAKTRYFIYQYFWKFIDLLYPPTCAGCGVFGFRWCNSCHSTTKKITQPYCQICHQPIPSGNICENCQKNKPDYQILRSWGIYDGSLRSAIHRLKYERDLSLGDVFSHYMNSAIRRHDWQIDLMIPVPLSKQRKRQRGYNQSAVLAKPLSYLLNVNYAPKSLKRIKDTKSQVGLSLAERLNNVKYAFQADPSGVLNKTILLIDDVCTSGATLNACAGALKRAGANSVFGYTLARAIRLE